MRWQPRAAFVVILCNIALIALTAPSRAAEPLGGGDCWRTGTPLWCRSTWTPGQHLRVYTLDRFSDQRPNWSSAYSASNSRWTSAAGPQILATYRRDRDSWIFYEDSSSGRDALTSSRYAITWNCAMHSTYCSPYNESMFVRFSSIKLNKDKLPNDSGTKTNIIVTHETGHALGLYHHPSSTDLMYANATTATPSADNGGVLPPCSGSGATTNRGNQRAGLRCVYNWKI